jgi:hypothetical protein
MMVARTLITEALLTPSTKVEILKLKNSPGVNIWESQS